MTDRTFTYVVPAMLLVSIEAPTEEAATEQFTRDILGQDFAIEFPTGQGHQLDDLTITAAGELYSVDGQEPPECRECGGYLVDSRCTSVEHPA